MPAGNRSRVDVIPEGIRVAQDYEALASQSIPPDILAYISGGSLRGQTLNANRVFFDNLEIVPRVMRDLSGASIATCIAGCSFTHPILLAPVAFHQLVHGNGETETARGAAATDTCFIASTLSSNTLEQIARSGNKQRWFQLYFQPQREHTLDLVRRAEAAEYSAIVVTVDAGIQPPSLTALKAGYTQSGYISAPNLSRYPVTPSRQSVPGEQSVFDQFVRNSPVWTDIEWLLGSTGLPVIVKGILHPEDAEQARRRGVAGVVVSNHGGRSLDGAVATIASLKSVRNATGNDYPVLLDGGIRSGTDVFKALALGADAVLVGRLQLYALAAAGALGVAHMIRLLREELAVCMAMAGCKNLSEIRRTTIHSRLRYDAIANQ